VLVCVGAFLAEEKSTFFAVSLAAGLGIGSLQSASRAMVGLFSPLGKTGEMYGFWGLAGKAAFAVGPLVFGSLSWATGSQRLAILSTGLFFVAGLIGMGRIDEARGRAAAREWTDRRERADVPAG
jgi:UMF1 family MFS transporter